VSPRSMTPGFRSLSTRLAVPTRVRIPGLEAAPIPLGQIMRPSEGASNRCVHDAVPQVMFARYFTSVNKVHTPGNRVMFRPFCGLCWRSLLVGSHLRKLGVDLPATQWPMLMDRLVKSMGRSKFSHRRRSLPSLLGRCLSECGSLNPPCRKHGHSAPKNAAAGFVRSI